MKRIFILFITFLIIPTFAFCAEENIVSNEISDGAGGVTSEEFTRIESTISKLTGEESIQGYMISLDINPVNENICISYRKNILETNWICLFDKYGNYICGFRSKSRGQEYPYWINNEVHVFSSNNSFVWVFDENGELLQIYDCYYTGIARESKQVEKEINGNNYKLLKTNILLPDAYTSLILIDENGISDEIVKCRHISETENLLSIIGSIIVLLTLLLIPIGVVIYVKNGERIYTYLLKKKDVKG